MRKKEQDNKLYARAVLVFITMVLAAGLLMHWAWRDYEEKMEILYAVLERQGEGTDPVDAVTGLLKGQGVTVPDDAEQRLMQYGFCESYANRYKKSLHASWGVIIVLFGMLFAGVTFLLVQADKRQDQVRKKELLWLQELVMALRGRASGSFRDRPDVREVNIVSSLAAEKDETGEEQCNVNSLAAEKHETGEEQSTYRQTVCSGLGDRRNILENYDEDLGRLLMEFAALADGIELFRQQAENEREGTKALVTDISHQLKTPVAALRTSFEILQSDGLSGAEYQEFLGRCRIQVVRLEELVSALVNISRMETGMIELKKKERKLFDTIVLAVNRIYPKAEEKGIEIELEADEDLRQAMVLHDSKWLCEAFLNVLENAVKYSAARTKIMIRMIKMTVYLRVEVEDEGIGIPRKEWNRIFQRFYRGGAEEVQRETGSGVGLYLAREIVSRHEGTLSVAAARHGKRGSCFVFQLPYEI